MSRVLATGAVAATMLLAGAATAIAATPAAGPSPEGSAVTSLAGTGTSLDAASALAAVSSKRGFSAASSGCTFYSRGDSVRLYSGAVTGHGWWDNVSCGADKARIRVRVQYLNSWGYWSNVGSVGKAKVSSGGGSGNRATVSAGCKTLQEHKFRSQVDVDLVGMMDDNFKLYTPVQTLACGW